jgi:RNA polymerase sigma factor (sigma-70 family)
VNPKLDEATREALVAEWSDARLAGLAFARRRCASAAEAEDHVQQVFESLLDGSRTWDRQKVPLVPFVFGVLRSKLSHRARDAARAAPSEDPGARPDPDPEQLLRVKQGAMLGFEILDEVRDGLDAFDRRVLDLWRAEVLEPEEQARELGVSPLTVRMARKRIRYALLKIAEKRKYVP